MKIRLLQLVSKMQSWHFFETVCCANLAFSLGKWSRIHALPRSGLFLRLLLVLALALSSASLPVVADSYDADQELLKRMYQIRMKSDTERMQRDNEARANVALQAQAQRGPAMDSPTVTQMRRDMYKQLTQIQNNYRCLDVDVENSGGNTVVICGDNSGDIGGEITTVGNDLIQIGGRP